MEQEIRLSVRSLTAFLLRSGSIDNRFGGDDRAAQGARLHRRLQREAGEAYRPEVTLRLQARCGDTAYRIEGRADGVFTEGGSTWIDEIKTTLRPLELIGEDFDRAHWGQAMCYAYLFAVEEGLQSIGVQLRYCRADTGEVKPFRRAYTREELEAFFYSLLEQYGAWAGWQRRWHEVRDGAIAALPFPFARYRAGQRELAVAVYRTVQARGRLFAQAPTGIGKTMSTLFPAVKALGEGLAEKLFYLTAKTTTQQAAFEALGRLGEAGLRLKAVALTAKDKVCPLLKRACNPVDCPYADGYYDRANDALYALLNTHDFMTREVIAACAEERRVCPFELSLDLTLWCDAVVCDYNYLFDPVVSLKRFFSEEGGEYVFLIDEAHNLVDRARGMYSAALQKSALLALRRKVGKRHPALSRALSRANAAFLAERRRVEEERPGGGALARPMAPDSILEAVSRLEAALSDWLAAHRESPLREDVLAFSFEALSFLRIAELYDGRFATLLTAEGGDLCVHLKCLDPSALLDAHLSLGRASVLFSATLSPAEYYAAVLGGGAAAKKISLPSPFDTRRLCLLAAEHISTRYADRARSVAPIAQLLQVFVGARAGNYLFYFPSYKYLREVLEAFCRLCPEVRTAVQSPGMGEREREGFLAQFAAGGTGTLAGFCVLGGVYAEGIDLRGERLIGTAVIGVGLPQVGAEQDLLRDYYERTQGAGFDFAYRYPGMNKVLQAVGRVIRSEEDRGAALLIDSRFASGAYRRLLPAHWQRITGVRSGEALAGALRRFWGETQP